MSSRINFIIEQANNKIVGSNDPIPYGVADMQNSKFSSRKLLSNRKPSLKKAKKTKFSRNYNPALSRARTASRTRSISIGQMPCNKLTNDMLEKAKSIYQEKLQTVNIKLKKTETENQKLVLRNRELVDLVMNQKNIENERNFYKDREKKYLAREQYIKQEFQEWRQIFFNLVNELQELKQANIVSAEGVLFNHEEQINILNKIKNTDWQDWAERIKTIEQRLGVQTLLESNSEKSLIEEVKISERRIDKILSEQKSIKLVEDYDIEKNQSNYTNLQNKESTQKFSEYDSLYQNHNDPNSLEFTGKRFNSPESDFTYLQIVSHSDNRVNTYDSVSERKNKVLPKSQTEKVIFIDQVAEDTYKNFNDTKAFYSSNNEQSLNENISNSKQKMPKSETMAELNYASESKVSHTPNFSKIQEDEKLTEMQNRYLLKANHNKNSVNYEDPKTSQYQTLFTEESYTNKDNLSKLKENYSSFIKAKQMTTTCLPKTYEDRRSKSKNSYYSRKDDSLRSRSGDSKNFEIEDNENQRLRKLSHDKDIKMIQLKQDFIKREQEMLYAQSNLRNELNSQKVLHDRSRSISINSRMDSYGNNQMTAEELFGLNNDTPKKPLSKKKSLAARKNSSVKKKPKQKKDKSSNVPKKEKLVRKKSTAESKYLKDLQKDVNSVKAIAKKITKTRNESVASIIPPGYPNTSHLSSGIISKCEQNELTEKRQAESRKELDEAEKLADQIFSGLESKGSFRNKENNSLRPVMSNQENPFQNNKLVKAMTNNFDN